MSDFRNAFLAAIVKSLLRGKSLIQAILSYWISPLAAGLDTKERIAATKSLAEFLKEAEAALLGPISGDGLAQLAVGLKAQFYDRLQNDEQCMLPSYSHQLPTGGEIGQYVSLDVGGSTLRVAVVELRGRDVEESKRSEILSMRNFRITPEIKDLEGMAFFNWMAQRISETIAESPSTHHSPEKPLPVALAWSFPIEQTSLGGGKLAKMGKAFLADQGLVGQDLGEIINTACKAVGLNAEVRAILNDSSACLLSRAYSHTSTRFGLILGTGLNLAVYLPVETIGLKKFGARPDGWFDEASHVIVNTELGMFGHDILPFTRWDKQLTRDHPRPDFQPLEYMVSGMYLGEIARLALIEAIETTGFLGGVVPPSLHASYSLGTETISMIESDTTPELTDAIKLFSTRHPSSHTLTTADMTAIKTLASYISVRSSALVATTVYTLWDVRLESEQKFLSKLPANSPLREKSEADIALDTTTVAFNGSVIENYPGYLNSCQRYVNDLVKTKLSRHRIDLSPAKESSLLGAAVGLACLDGEA